jgi:hypothetical protein
MQPRRDKMLLRPARTLDELYRTISPEPLVSPDEIKAFYRPELNDLRKKDLAHRLERRVEQIGEGFFHVFLVGQQGSGKSTEISRFLDRVQNRYWPLRIFISREINPVTFEPHDVLLLLIFKLAEAVEELNAELPPEKKLQLPESILRDLLLFFGTEARTTESVQAAELTVGTEASAGLPKLWSAFLKFAISASGKLRVGYKEETKLVQYRFQMLGQLTELANRFLDACNDELRKLENRTWLIVMEEFDKQTVSASSLRETFVERGSIFDQLSIHLLITVPAWLFYSSDGQRLPFGRRGKTVLTDTPLYNRDHSVNSEGLDAIRAVLAARADLSLFTPDALNLLLRASGGNIRELFGLVMEAGDTAALARRHVIEYEDAKSAVFAEIEAYRNRLGYAQESAQRIPYTELRDKLKAVYEQEPASKVPDEALNQLLRSRAILHFNDVYWYGVHPIVVDILKEQEVLARDARGGAL